MEDLRDLARIGAALERCPDCTIGEVDALTTFFREEEIGEASLHAAFAARGNR